MSEESSPKVPVHKGRLILASGPIGDTADIPPRSLDALKRGDLLVFEEDRMARQLLKAAGVHREYLRLSEHKQSFTLEQVRKTLAAGQTVVYMSDQGTPNLADPGLDLLKVAREAEAKIKVIPGPSSVTAALAACPFPHDKFTFAGFLPRSDHERVAALKKLREITHPIIILDTPYRLVAVLESCTLAFSDKYGWKGFLALDITGQKEDYWVGSFNELLAKSAELEEKTNFVLIIGREHEVVERKPKQPRYRKPR